MSYTVLWLFLTSALPVFAQLASNANDTFVLSGTVVNSVTGEAISRALVRAGGQSARTTFTDSEGHFQFEGMTAGQVMLTAQKPGYVSEQDATGDSQHPLQLGPGTGSQTLKLQPLSAIYGRVTDVAGQPIEHIAVRLTARSLREGRKIWEPHGMSETDDDGRFRFAALTPATYYVSVGPAVAEQRILPEGEKPTTGFPHVYFPGVPDLASAAPIQLTPGQQLQADFSLSPVVMYAVTGAISGLPPDRSVSLLTFTSAGDELMLPAKVNSDLGTFSLDAVPAGSYILKAMTNSQGQSLRAEQRITVAANLDNVHLSLAPMSSIPVVVQMQSRESSNSSGSARPAGWSNPDKPPLHVALLPTQPNSNEAYSSYQQRSPGKVGMVLKNVEPGTYTVNLLPRAPWYVQSASYGQNNALYEDITVTAGQSSPLDISLRDDSASLTVNVRNLDPTGLQKASVVILPQPASKLAPHVLRGVTSSSTETGLAPGDYLVFAFDRIDGLEYTNADALEPYASQAAHVTLSANQQAQVSLDLIRVGKEQ